MNLHKYAPSTPQSRALLVQRMLREHWPVSAVGMAFGISERTVYKWLARYRAAGVNGLRDPHSTAHHRPHALAPAWLALIRLLPQGRLVRIVTQPTVVSGLPTLDLFVTTAFVQS
jgi:transposase